MESVYYAPEVFADHAAMQLRVIWLTWEKLRILYNFILLSEGINGLLILRLLGTVTKHDGLLYGPALWKVVILLGVFANLFFFLGPIVETVVCAVIGSRSEGCRPYLFMAGLFFSMYIIFCMGTRMWGHMVGYL